MKTKYTLAAVMFFAVLFLTSCSKQDYYAGPTDEQEWMRTHEKGTVALVDHPTGSYIVETYQGYAVVDNWGGLPPHKYDNEFAWFSNPGTQTIYNYDGNYYSTARVAASFLSWPDALTVLDQITHSY